MAELMEKGLVSVKLATQLDSDGEVERAIVAYREGVEYFLTMLKRMCLLSRIESRSLSGELTFLFFKDETNEHVKDKIRPKLTEYLDRAETLKRFLDKRKQNEEEEEEDNDNDKESESTETRDALIRLDSPGIVGSGQSESLVSPGYRASTLLAPTPAQAAESSSAEPGAGRVAHAKLIRIDEGSVGHTYASLFGDYLRGATQVTLADPYLRQRHQFFNFVRFGELIVRAASIRRLLVITKAETKLHEAGIKEFMREVGVSLAEHNVALQFSFSEHLHDREMHVDRSWIIRMGRGLDIYQPPSSRFSVGLSDLSLRRCRECTVEVYKVLDAPSSSSVASTENRDPLSPHQPMFVDPSPSRRS
jgi:Phospholipase D-like domain at C-terminus of MIT